MQHAQSRRLGLCGYRTSLHAVPRTICMPANAPTAQSANQAVSQHTRTIFTAQLMKDVPEGTRHWHCCSTQSPSPVHTHGDTKRALIGFRHRAGATRHQANERRRAKGKPRARTGAGIAGAGVADAHAVKDPAAGAHQVQAPALREYTREQHHAIQRAGFRTDWWHSRQDCTTQARARQPKARKRPAPRKHPGSRLGQSRALKGGQTLAEGHQSAVRLTTISVATTRHVTAARAAERSR